ncbi:MAG: hypothetical protein ABR573_00195 [Candidatus Dormibacteria bacterium]
MALPSFPADDPATQEAERLLGPRDSKLRAQVREAAAAALRGEPAVTAAEARKRLARMPRVADELAALDAPAPSDSDL